MSCAEALDDQGCQVMTRPDLCAWSSNLHAHRRGLMVALGASPSRVWAWLELAPTLALSEAKAGWHEYAGLCF